MDKYYVVVAGSGETSRANVEALVEDYVYANGSEVIFVFAYEKKPTAGQVFISQWAKDKTKEIVIFANADAKYDGITAATVNNSEFPYQDAVAFLSKSDKAVGFILWNDNDPKSNEIVEAFNKKSVKCFDLTDGLNAISIGQLPKEVAPAIPAAEMITPKAEDEDDEDDLEDEEAEDLDEESDELLEEAYFGLQALVKAIAREVVREMSRQEKPSKGV